MRDNMINKYKVKKIGNEEILYLYFDFNMELASFKNNNKSFLDTIKDFLKTNKIKYYGKKIAIVASGVLLCTLCFTVMPKKIDDINYTYVDNVIFEDLKSFPTLEDNSSSTEDFQEMQEQDKVNIENDQNTTDKNNSNKNNSNDKPSSNSDKNSSKNESVAQEEKVTVYRSNGEVITIALEDYVIGVVAAEMPASFNSEALKAQAVLARTYALNYKKENRHLTDTTATQVYKDNSQLKKLWGSDYNKYYQKVKNAVLATKGVVLTYNGDYIEAFYHSTSNGKTEDALNVFGVSYPYLKSVDSSWDKNVSSYERVITEELSTLNSILGIELTPSNFTITKNASGRVATLTVAGEIFTGVEIRTLLGLRSTDFTLEVSNNQVKITTRGYGHGVGMSQYGANEMAKLGYNYRSILNHYYQGVTFKTIK